MIILKRFSEDNKNNGLGLAIGTGSIGAGALAINRIKGNRLTGKVTRYHDTATENVNNILKEGLKSKYSKDPKNITNTIVADHLSDKSVLNDLVYTSKNKKDAFSVGTRRAQIRGQLRNNGFFENFMPHKDVVDEIKRGKSPYHKVLKLEFDYDDIKRRPKILNPELLGAKSAEEFKNKTGCTANMAKEAFNKLSDNTHIFKGDIDPSHIVGGRGYHRRSLKQVLKYAKNNPKRFGKEAVKGVAGLALLGYGSKKLYDYSRTKKDKT